MYRKAAAATPAYRATPRALPSGSCDRAHFRLRYDITTVTAPSACGGQAACTTHVSPM